MKIVNLTPHEINIVKEGSEETSKNRNNVQTIAPSGIIARCEQTQILIGEINNIHIYKTEFGNVINLPEADKNTVYITSTIVAQAVKGKRNDVFVPYDSVRDDKGVIIGCRSLAQI